MFVIEETRFYFDLGRQSKNHVRTQNRENMMKEMKIDIDLFIYLEMLCHE